MLYANHLWCDDFRQAVQHQLDGEDLSDGVRRSMREHREACPSCCEFHDRLLQVAVVSGELVPPKEYEAGDDIELWKKIINGVTK
jgi:hypothetical protein